MFGRAPTKAAKARRRRPGARACPRTACAAAVRLLTLGYFRIGNDVYADENGSVLAWTTLEWRHVRRRQDHLVFAFVGKSGVEHHIEIDDVTVTRRSTSAPPRGRTHTAAGLPRGPVVAVDPAGPGQRVRAFVDRPEATAMTSTARHRARGAALAESPEPGRPRRRASGRSRGDEGGRRSRQHADAGAVVVRRPVGRRRLRGRGARSSARRAAPSTPPDERHRALERATPADPGELTLRRSRSSGATSPGSRSTRW